MTEPLAEQDSYMAVVKRIIDDPAIFPVFDNPQGTEQPQSKFRYRVRGDHAAPSDEY